jgi:hypothetical protein
MTTPLKELFLQRLRTSINDNSNDDLEFKNATDTVSGLDPLVEN